MCSVDYANAGTSTLYFVQISPISAESLVEETLYTTTEKFS